jgi:hypothetical protein
MRNSVKPREPDGTLKVWTWCLTGLLVLWIAVGAVYVVRFMENRADEAEWTRSREGRAFREPEKEEQAALPSMAPEPAVDPLVDPGDAVYQRVVPEPLLPLASPK